jgi:tRNA pseudouridine38-40 synthase
MSPALCHKGGVARFKLVVEYAGTRYRGWQVQKNARTVQGEIRDAVGRLSGRRDFDLQGSGRTDAGVHALAQVAHLDLETRLTPQALAYALNDGLPADIGVLSAEKVPRQFHARHSAVGRSYLYQIARRRTAFGKPFVWWIKDRLETRAMAEAAALFAGMQDFRAFTDSDPEESSTRVLVEEVALAEAGDLILVRVRGSHFIWKMVRRMVGVLAEVGRGGLAAADVRQLLRGPSARPAQLTAPSSGLFLERVFYEGDPREHPLRAAVPLWSRDAGRLRGA